MLMGNKNYININNSNNINININNSNKYEEYEENEEIFLPSVFIISIILLITSLIIFAPNGNLKDKSK